MKATELENDSVENLSLSLLKLNFYILTFLKILFNSLRISLKVDKLSTYLIGGILKI